MTVHMHEMTREQIKAVAPGAIGVLCTAATEQHGPHMAVGTDTLLVNYWDIAKPAMVAAGLLPAAKIPGHAGHFETSAILSLRPDWVDEKARAGVTDMEGKDSGLDVDLTGAVVQTHGAWGKGPGHTDNPAAASAELGEKLLDIAATEVARFFRDFSKVPGPVTG
jgi:creatinine amidohydrolase/Fe(II)-dependent formamide hydrolase-like protein